MNSFSERATRELHKLEAAGLRRQPRKIEGAQGPRLRIDGKEVLCLCANDYLGLAAHPTLQRAAQSAFEAQGLGAGGARHISGNMAAHCTAEHGLAEFVGQGAAALFSTGYAANVGTVQALLGPGDLVFSDRLNHASLIDGARLSRASVIIYEHANVEDLRLKLRAHRARGGGALIQTESVFSMDGDVAPLRPLAQLAREFETGLLVDEAHALGVFGPEGRGLCVQHGVLPDVTIGTMGKAFGSQGAFAAGSPPVVELIQNRARSYLFSTAPWPAVGEVATAALELVRGAEEARLSLARHWRTLRDGLSSAGYRVLAGDSPIIPVLIGEAEETMQVSRRLFDRGVFVHGVRPPTVPAGTSRLRVVPMASHSADDIQEALAAFAEVRR